MPVVAESITENDFANDGKLSEASKIISSATTWAAAAGAVPVPVLDLVALAAVQTRMIMDLSATYGQSFSKESAKAIVSVMLGTLVPGVATGALLGSAIKAAPVVGSLAGMISMAAFGAAATYAVGKVFVRHLSSGGVVADFSADAIKNELKSEFRAAAAKQADK